MLPQLGRIHELLRIAYHGQGGPDSPVNRPPVRLLSCHHLWAFSHSRSLELSIEIIMTLRMVSELWPTHRYLGRLWVMLFRVALSPPGPSEARLVVSGNLQYPVCLQSLEVESHAC